MLQARNVHMQFGGVRAVSDVSIEVGKGEIVGLIGTNGAGKTTLFNIVSGFLRPSRGSVLLDGKDVTGWPPHSISKLGMLRTFQTPVGFPRMTVMENMLVFDPGADTRVGHALFNPRSGSIDRQTAERARGIAADLGFRDKLDVWAQDLSAPELKLLEFARALMAGSRLLLLDEPAAGVNPALLDQLVSLIRGLNARGTTLVIVDHNLGFISKICDRVYAMADGSVIASGTSKQVLENPAVIDCYIGKAPARTKPAGALAMGSA
ncbi:MAG: ABC transporter ATP-binding protein [Parvibaculaceae bacterium]